METTTFTARRTFVADHFHDLPGFMEPRHGHNWELEAEVALGPAEEPASRLTLEQALDAWVGQVDYTLLNGQSRLSGRNPTTELLAAWVLEDLEDRGLRPLRVRVREKANYWAECGREPA